MVHWFLSTVLLGLVLQTAMAVDVYQTTYSSHPLSAKEVSKLEALFGCKVIVLPYDGKPPSKPRRVSGIVIHANADDAKWVVGSENPVFEADEIGDKFFEDKMAESRLLDQYAPSLSPPTKLGSDFLQPGSSAKNLEEIRKLIKKTMGTNAILKPINGFGSDGHLPTTEGNWADLFDQYLKTTKPAIESIKAQGLDPEKADDAINKLPAIEAQVLEEFLEHPENVLVQTKLQILKEVRVHIIQGKILTGGTVVRFDRMGLILSDNDARKIEHIIQTHFLDHLPSEVRRLSAAMDIAITSTGYFIIDANPGISSGMYYPENDLYISNLLASLLSGTKTNFILEMDEFERADLATKRTVLRRLNDKYSAWISETDSYGFYDRIIKSYGREFDRAPTAATLNEILSQFASAGVRNAWWYHSQMAEIYSRFPEFRLPPEILQKWVRQLTEWDADMITTSRDGRLTGKATLGRCTELFSH